MPSLTASKLCCSIAASGFRCCGGTIPHFCKNTFFENETLKVRVFNGRAIGANEGTIEGIHCLNRMVKMNKIDMINSEKDGKMVKMVTIGLSCPSFLLLAIR